MTPQSRSFPDLSWAWPRGGRLLLLRAALVPDEDRALKALEDWFAQQDLDDAGYPEHRLLAAIATRFGSRLAHLPEYPRLIGLQRLNWTRSRMTVAAARPALEAMVDAGLKIVLLKGACRVALDPAEQKARTSYDLDLLLPGTDFDAAFEILAAHGWMSSRGESTLGLRARLSSVQARNFKKGQFGDIDLHRNAYHFGQQNAACDAALLQELRAVSYYGLPVFIPSAEERLAMATGHGAWDGQQHSDWLVDVVRVLETERVDWARLEQIARGRGVIAPLATALAFLRDDIGTALPETEVGRFVSRHRRARVRDMPALIIARDQATLTGLQRVFRMVVRLAYGLRFSGRKSRHDTPVFRSLTRKVAQRTQAPTMTEIVLPLPEDAKAGQWRVDLQVEIDLPALRRRLEFEINAPDRNLCHFQGLHLTGKSGRHRLRLNGKVRLDKHDWPLTLSALPSKFIESEPGSEDHEKYAARPARLVSCRLTCLES